MVPPVPLAILAPRPHGTSGSSKGLSGSQGQFWGTASRWNLRAGRKKSPHLGPGLSPPRQWSGGNVTVSLVATLGEADTESLMGMWAVTWIVNSVDFEEGMWLKDVPFALIRGEPGGGGAGIVNSGICLELGISVGGVQAGRW